MNSPTNALVNETAERECGMKLDGSKSCQEMFRG
jgi:hypothetical protein